MQQKVIHVNEDFIALQSHYLSCGKDYDQEVYGGYAQTLTMVLRRIDAGALVKITGWQCATGVFLQKHISEITVYNVQEQHRERCTAIIQKAYTHLPFVTVDRDNLVFASESPQTENCAPVLWAKQADVYHLVHHNQVLDCIEKYLDDDTHPVLVHLDTHSDFMINPVQAPETIASYINALMLLRNNRDEQYFDKHFYWVIPEHKQADIEIYDEQLYGCDIVCHGVEDTVPYTRTYFIAADGFLHKEPLSGTREIIVHVCRLQDLQGQNQLHGKKVVLDIDLDFFSCKSKYNPSQVQLRAVLDRTNALLQEWCAPAVVFVCQSPDYTPAEDNEFLNNYFSAIPAKQHVYPDVSSLTHTGSFASDVYYVRYLRERQAVLKNPVLRRYLFDILKQRQLYAVLAAAEQLFDDPARLDQELHALLQRMLFATIGLTGAEDYFL